MEEAARKYAVEEKVLTQLIEAGMIETHETPTGDVFVVAEKNGNGPEPQTKEEIIAAKFAHLREKSISASEASRKYSKIHGIPVSHVLFGRWAKAGYITVRQRGYRLQMDEAEVAYCAEIFARKYQEYGGPMSGVRIFDEDGNPYQLKYPEMAAYKREHRRRTNQEHNEVSGESN